MQLQFCEFGSPLDQLPYKESQAEAVRLQGSELQLCLLEMTLLLAVCKNTKRITWPALP